jgi:hypothetical protein
VNAPGWWTSDIPAGKPPDRFRSGHADLGVAHGIAVIFRFKSLMQVEVIHDVKAHETRWS